MARLLPAARWFADAPGSTTAARVAAALAAYRSVTGSEPAAAYVRAQDCPPDGLVVDGVTVAAWQHIPAGCVAVMPA